MFLLKLIDTFTTTTAPTPFVYDFYSWPYIQTWELLVTTYQMWIWWQTL